MMVKSVKKLQCHETKKIKIIFFNHKRISISYWMIVKSVKNLQFQNPPNIDPHLGATPFDRG